MKRAVFQSQELKESIKKKAFEILKWQRKSLNNDKNVKRNKS